MIIDFDFTELAPPQAGEDPHAWLERWQAFQALKGYITCPRHPALWRPPGEECALCTLRTLQLAMDEITMLRDQAMTRGA